MLRRDALPRMGMRRCKRRAVIDSERSLVVELSGSSPKFILPQARSAAQCRSGVTSFQWWHYISGVSSRRSIGAEVNSVRVPFDDLPLSGFSRGMQRVVRYSTVTFQACG